MRLICYFQGMVARIPCVILVLLFAISGTAGAQQRKTDTLVVHFAFDRSEIGPGDSAMIRDNFIHRQVDSVVVIGYTDTVGSTAYNLRLSERRAISATKTIVQWLPRERSMGRYEFRGEAEALPGDDSLSRRAVIFVFRTEPAPPPAKPAADTPHHAEGEPDTTIALRNINFIANTAILTDSARVALPQSLPLLRQLSDRYLEIDGYCNQPGPVLPKTDPLFILSVHRAKYIYEYLLASGFDSTHLSYKGMGNASPKNEHPVTKADMDENMRVEIRVFRIPPKP
jgi:outer membrane protein OmpA-like peptidoglycan-associated protein